MLKMFSMGLMLKVTPTTMVMAVTFCSSFFVFR